MFGSMVVDAMSGTLGMGAAVVLVIPNVIVVSAVESKRFLIRMLMIMM